MKGSQDGRTGVPGYHKNRGVVINGVRPCLTRRPVLLEQISIAINVGIVWWKYVCNSVARGYRRFGPVLCCVLFVLPFPLSFAYLWPRTSRWILGAQGCCTLVMYWWVDGWLRAVLCSAASMNLLASTWYIFSFQVWWIMNHSEIIGEISRTRGVGLCSP